MSEIVKENSAQIAEKENPIITGPIWQQLLYFFFPILFGSFFQQMYNTVDAIIVGQFVGKAALAAVGGSTNVLISFLINLFTGISSGATVIIAQLYGAKRFDDVHKTVHTSMAMTLIAGVGIMILGFFLSKPALLMMGTPEDILPHATTYMKIYFLGSIPSFIYNIGSGILRAVGDNKRPLYFLIAACITNIILDIILVVLLNLGVGGAALATILSQLVAAILVVLVLTKTKAIHRLEIKSIKLDVPFMKDILKVGIPTGLQSNMYTISNICLQASINSFGTNTVAAWTAFTKIDNFYWMICGAFGISITTFVGQNYGAGKIERVRKSVKTCLIMTFAASALMSIIFVTFAEPLLSIFTKDTEVLKLAVQVIQLFCPFYVCYVCIEVLSGAIRGSGNSIIPMILTCFGVCVLRIAWVFLLLPKFHFFEMIIMSYPASWTVCSIMFIIYYAKCNWLKQ